VTRRFDTVAVDTSALVAVFLQEDDPVDYGFYLHRFYCLIGWPTLVEFHLVMSEKTGRDDQHEIIDYLQDQPNIRFVHFGAEHFRAAAAAFVRYGKGRHPAKLNYGDCMAYAVAKAAGVPILFKGSDFTRTDLASAVGLP
jgi:ribonuclease VapC